MIFLAWTLCFSPDAKTFKAGIEGMYEPGLDRVRTENTARLMNQRHVPPDPAALFSEGGVVTT